MRKKGSAIAVSHYNVGRKKPKKALKIVLGILIAVIVVLGILFALNYKTILLASGKGNVKISGVEQIKKSFSDTGLFNTLSEATDADGSTVLTGVTKDSAITFTITQKKDGKETVMAQINLAKLNTGSISKSDLLKGNLSAVTSAKSMADKFLIPIVGKDTSSGIEAYLAEQALIQSKKNTNNISINHNFGSTNVNLNGNLSTEEAILMISK